MGKAFTQFLAMVFVIGVGAGLARGETLATAAAEDSPPTAVLPNSAALPSSFDKGSEADSACADCKCCCDDVGDWLDNTQIWLGAEVYKSIGDSNAPLGVASGFMDSAGLVTGFNTGFALGSSSLRGQLGASYGAYDFEGRDTVPPSASSSASLEQQVYLTAGVYKRSDVCDGDRISYALVYDQFFGHQWGMFGAERSLGQVRGILGYALSECNEVGVWGTAHADYDNSTIGIDPPRLRAMDQANAYWRHHCDFGGTTMLYLGAMNPADLGSWQFGFLGEAPLSDSVSLYANFNYVAPGAAAGPIGANELQWDLGLGLVYSFGGKAASDSVSGQAGLPLLPVANNGSLLITN